MIDDEYNLHRCGNYMWGSAFKTSDILQLSEIQCDQHCDEISIFRQFFHPTFGTSESQTSLKKANFLSCSEMTIGACENNESAEKIMEVHDEIEEIRTQTSVNRKIGGDTSHNDVVDLICILDEQTATTEQLSTVPDQKLEPVLARLSDRGLCHICTLVCSMSASEQSRLGSLVCRHLLVPRLRDKNNESCSRAVVKALIEFTKCLPHLGCIEVLLPLMLMPQALKEKDILHQIITDALNSQHKENLLRNFLQSEPGKLNDWQLPLIQDILSTSCGNTARQQLVQLLAASADDLAVNTRFTKLLISVIQQLGPGAPPDIQQQLASVVSCNKSVLKKAAEKALRAL